MAEIAAPGAIIVTFVFLCPEKECCHGALVAIGQVHHHIPCHGKPDARAKLPGQPEISVVDDDGRVAIQVIEPGIDPANAQACTDIKVNSPQRNVFP